MVRVKSRDMSNGEEILRRILQRIAVLGITESSVGVQAGLSRDLVRSIRRGIETGRQRGVSSDTIQKIAPVLKTSPQWLLIGEGQEEVEQQGGDEQLPTIALEGSSTIEIAPVDIPLRSNFKLDIPVMGTAAGSIIRHVDGFRMEHEIIDVVRRPPALAKIERAYAIYVVGDSMSPKHDAGDLCFINPSERPQINDSVIVQTKQHDDDPGQAYIKILKKRTTKHLVLEQLNPPCNIEIPLEFVVVVHRVMTIKDLFGA